MLTDVRWGPVIPWHSWERTDPFSFFTWMLDFSNSHCTLRQPISVPMPKVFSHRGSPEDDFPEVQSSWNVKNNFPSKLYSNGSVPLSLLRHLLVTQMKEEEGWHGDNHSPIAVHNVPTHSFPIQWYWRSWICNVLTVCASGLARFVKGCGRLPQRKMPYARITCALWAAREATCESKPLVNW